ncbi:hypothetical protein MTP99_013287 [Tenebrio molitor]|nr:hypothetical protein MTP99_013287 [Tenebrio molitor]
MIHGDFDAVRVALVVFGGRVGWFVRRGELREPPGALELRQLQLRYALQYVQPAGTQVVAVGVSDLDQRLDRVDVLRFHLRGRRVGGQMREPGGSD